MKMKMIRNIFNIFDPSTNQTFSLNWINSMIIFVTTPFIYWHSPSRYSFRWFLLINFILKEFKILIKYSFSNLIIFISLFRRILLNNFIGLFPYIFTSSRHLRFNLSISLSLWIAIILYRIFNYLNKLCIHLTPQGTPFIIIPFIVIIESIRLIIRPITLRVRLTANIIAGHLLLSLIGSSGSFIPFLIIIPLLIPQTLLYILELSVAIIQAYVFSILSTLYSREI